MSKGILLVCLFVALSAQAISSQEGASFESFTGNIIGEKVRLRTQPNLEGYVVRETTNGELFEVVGEENDFYAIIPPKGMKGYLFRTYVLDEAVEGEHVNVRLYPDMDAPVLGQLNTGDKVDAVVSDINDKWLEIDFPKSCRLYIAKGFVEKKGPLELLGQIEKRNHEGSHLLNSALALAQAEIQKPFEQIDFDTVSEKLNTLIENYKDLSDISEHAQEAKEVIQEIYVQKKVAFLQSKAEKTTKPVRIDPAYLERLAKLGIEYAKDKEVATVGEAVSETVGVASIVRDDMITDKMRAWEPVEESLFHLWAASDEGGSLESFYDQQQSKAIVLTGIVESYNRPVKNKPGDFILRTDKLPVAFLYSTKVNLQNFEGKNVTIRAYQRPNNNFAFPAYFVLSVE
ncbi:MAG: SH3 domain-containing protein [Chlamydiales bacterium]